MSERYMAMAVAVEIIIHWRKLAKANRHWHRFTKEAKPAYFHGYPQWTRNKKAPSDEGALASLALGKKERLQ